MTFDIFKSTNKDFIFKSNKIDKIDLIVKKENR